MTQISASKASSSLSVVHNDDPTEKAIQKAIDGIHFFLNPSNMTPEEQEKKAVIKISEATRKYCELQIRTLKDAPRDSDMLRELLEKRERQYEEAEDSEVIEILVTEIEMLKFVQFLVNRSSTSPPNFWGAHQLNLHAPPPSLFATWTQSLKNDWGYEA